MHAPLRTRHSPAEAEVNEIGYAPSPMADRILVLYGSYRSDRRGIRLADFLVSRLSARGAAAELIDARAV
ncbi:MAG TPA: hypothetical protein VKQ54_11225, partial [Caulobacteraceae bacterium]|nr:hypothetical protein [Caulobacteraceae bacterium]